VILALACVAAPVRAQQTVPFTMIGHIQAFHLNAPCANVLCGATIKVNGVTVIIPANTIIQFPARYLAPQDVFRFRSGVHPVARPTDPVLPFSGLALEDPAPYTPIAAYEAEIVDNLVPFGAVTAYVAGLVKISQQSLNTTDGYILSINSATEEMSVGPEHGSAGATVARVQLNDPKITDTSNPSWVSGTGRFGIGISADARFLADRDNATIHSTTGYPMCIRRSGSDPECPAFNRPANVTGNPATRFTMGPVDALAALPAGPGVFPAPSCSACRPAKQAPLRVGDRVTVAGTLARDARGTFLSAHTVIAWVAIYTQPGVNPAYISVEDSRPCGLPGIFCTSLSDRD
jgi:hypothetical protein